jgi:hypothetical protein
METENRKFPNESETVEEYPHAEKVLAAFVSTTGEPELKSRPARNPKYQILFSPWEKQKRGKNRKAKIKNRVNLWFITRNC